MNTIQLPVSVVSQFPPLAQILGTETEISLPSHVRLANRYQITVRLDDPLSVLSCTHSEPESLLYEWERANPKLLTGLPGQLHSLLQRETQHGHLWTGMNRLPAAVRSLLEYRSWKEMLGIYVSSSGQHVWKRKFLEAEELIARQILLRRRTQAGLLGEGEAKALLAEFVNLTDEQREGAVNALTKPDSMITGGPGTGKSTTVEAIKAAAENAQLSVALTAPTADAARRLDALEGVTIHRLLAWGKDGPSYHADRTLPYDLVIADESSMNDVVLMAALYDALSPGSHIVWLGDRHQLPPVGPGLPFIDLIASGCLPVMELTYHHRFGSEIATLCESIRNQSYYDFSPRLQADRRTVFLECPDEEIAPTIERLYRDVPNIYGIQKEEMMTLASMRKGLAGVDALAQAVREAVYGQKATTMRFIKGEELLWTKNQYKLGLTNGMEVKAAASVRYGRTNKSITVLDEQAEPITVKMSDWNAIPSVARTVHRMQGKQRSCVITACPEEHAFMLNNPLLLTSCSRAQHLSIVVGSRERFEKGIRNRQDVARRTGLRFRFN